MQTFSPILKLLNENLSFFWKLDHEIVDAQNLVYFKNQFDEI